MTSANLAVCVAPAMLWQARRASLTTAGDTHMMRDSARLSALIQRMIDSEDYALFGDDLAYPTPFADYFTTPSEPSVFSDSPAGYESCTFFSANCLT